MPARGDIEPADIPRLLPALVIAEVEPSPLRFRMRLVGTEVVTMCGCDITGLYLDEIGPDAIQDTLTADFTEVVSERRPTYRRRRYWSKDTRFLSYERLLMPLGDAGVISHLIACIDEIPSAPDDLSPATSPGA